MDRTHVFIFQHAFIKLYCVPSVVLSAGSTAVTKMDKIHTLVELTFTRRII